ncbi:MAG: hypothetical protein LBT01_02620 [Spirochaetaceae bacterium]|nr:hypothetical protein [Spirochaetaceae bacterium]
MQKITLVIVLFFSLQAGLSAVDFYDGRIKLTINERNGRFSLHYMTDVDKKKYEPLFWDKDRKTSFLSVYIDGTEYRLGDASGFQVFLRGSEHKPLLAFESPLLSITEEFSFIRTASSGLSNGVRIDIKIQNWGDKRRDIGSRLLIDTSLGEANTPNFRTDSRPIEKELIIDRTSQEQWWVSNNGRYGLMGSIFVEGIDPPDFLHFANWKRLYGVNFKPEYVPGRNFNALPFSIRDSAAAYYLDTRPLERWQIASYTVLLAAEDKYGFEIKKDMPSIMYETIYNVPDTKIAILNGAQLGAQGAQDARDTIVTSNQQQQQQQMVSPQLQGYPQYAPAPPSSTQSPAETQASRGGILLPIGPIRVDLMTLRELIYKVDSHIYFGTPISEEELRGMEMAIGRLRSKYGGIFSPY